MPGFQFAFLRAAAPVRGRRSALALALLVCSVLAAYYIVLPPPARGLSSDVVLSQIYGGGGATTGTPTYVNDYVELFNRGANPVTLTGYALQYGSATGNFGNIASQIYAISTVTIQPGKYLLIQVGAAGTVGAALPVTPDQTTGNVSMSAASGKIALTNTTTALGCGATASLCTLPDARVVDSVSYGAANNGEGGTTVNNGTALANTQGAVRKTNGCTETDNNNSDFNVVSAPVPRNSGTATNPCTPLTPTLNINDVALSEGNAGTTTFSFTVSLTAAAPVGGVSFTATTADNTATTADNDYQFKTQNLTIPEGQTSATFDASVNGDMIFEPNESFFVNLSAITGATAGDVQGQGTINNDDASLLPLLSINDVALAEGNAGTTTFTFTVSLSSSAGAGGVTFDIATQDGSATVANNDYAQASQIGKLISPGQSSTTFDVTVNGDTTGEPDESFTVNITNVVGASVNDGTGQGAIQNDDLTLTLIHDIQGTGETPNFAGQSKVIQGIVVGSFQTSASLSGFFVEEEQSDWDADANTSEGIFVFDGAAPATTVSVGDKVTVTGTVLNFGGPPGLTQLSPTTSVVVNSSGNPLPPVQTVTLPVGTSPAADLEKYEGMRVQFTQPLFVTDNDDLAHFGELSLAANSQLYIPTNSVDPNDNPATGNNITGNSNVAAVTAQQTANNNSRIILDDGKGGTYPNPIPFLGAGTNATIRLGDSVTSLAGVLSYGFGSYRIEPTGTVSFNALNPRQATPGAVGSGTLRAVSFNVENYFATTGTGRGPDNATELMRKRAKVTAALAGLNADVIGLIELEKGTQAVPDAALNDIIAGLNTLGVGTYAVVPTPTAVYTVPVGTDVDIKSGIIYRTSTVSTVGASFTDTTAAVGTYSRAPIAQTFQQTSNGQKFTFVINHFRSKSCPGTGGDADLGDGQACFNDRRRNQAQSLVAFVNTTIVPLDPDVLVAGDLNAYGQEDPIDVFRAAGYTDLIGQYVPLASQYSYTFNGETGRLDHVFATSGLANQTTGTTIWHINADEPSAFDYNTENKPDDRFAATPYASADHNPILVGLALSSACPLLSISPTTLPSGTYNVAYNQTLMASGGSGNYSFAVQNGSSLPAGLLLSNAGVISGMPTQTGSTTFTFIVTDTTTNCTGNRTYTIGIQCPTINLAPAALPNPVLGAAYNQTLTGSGGVGPYTIALHAGSSLPLGLNLSGSAITGTPTQGGPFTFTLDVTDTGLAIGPGNCGGNRTYTVTVGCPAITVSPAAVPSGTTGSPYGPVQLMQTGGNGTITWSVSVGSLPTGITLSPLGALAGTPTVTGSFPFTIRATDANSCFGERAYTLALNPLCTALSVNPATLAHGFQGTPYSQTLTATGGTAPYTFAVTTGSLPGGLTLASGGALTGTPTAAGTFNFTVLATDNSGCTGTRAYTVIVSGTGLQFYPLAAPVRLLDTRMGASPDACSQPNMPIAGGMARTQPGRNICTIPAHAAALTGNVTTVNSGGGFLTLYPSEAAQPTVANTNYGPNEIINNVFTVGLGADGAFRIFALNTTDVVVDVTGYYAPPGAANPVGLFFHPLPAPVRLLETRTGQTGCVMPGAPLTFNTESTQLASSPCTGIPAAARAIVGNATTVNPQGGGFLTIFPADAVRPLVAASNYNPGQIVNGPFAVGLAANGQFKIYTTSTTDLVVDVLGYYSAEVLDANGAGLLLTPLAQPVRLLETRPNEPVGCFKPGAPLMGGAETAQTARGVCDGLTIPANALGVVGNATVVQPVAAGFLTLWPSTATRPLAATSNYNAGDIGNRHFIVGLGQVDGAFKLYTHATSHLVVDLSGYFAP